VLEELRHYPLQEEYALCRCGYGNNFSWTLNKRAGSPDKSTGYCSTMDSVRIEKMFEEELIMVTLIATAKAKPGKEALLTEEAVKLAKLVREKESGCLMYVPHVAADNPAVVVFVEKYVDQAAFDFHGQTQYFNAFLKACEDILAGDLQLQFLQELI
jgi:quinol monooxygenase YgiN